MPEKPAPHFEQVTNLPSREAPLSSEPGGRLTIEPSTPNPAPSQNVPPRRPGAKPLKAQTGEKLIESYLRPAPVSEPCAHNTPAKGSDPDIKKISESTFAWPPKDLKHLVQVNRTFVVNKLNYLNFQDGTLYVNFRHTRLNHVISFKAQPQPCLGDQLICVWSKGQNVTQKIRSYTFKDILVPHDTNSLLITPELVDLDETAVYLRLPRTAYEVSCRQNRRFACPGIDVRLIQNSAVFKGRLLDYSPASFRVELAAKAPQNFQWVNADHPVNIVFTEKHHTLYSGECRITKQSFGQKTRTFVLKPLDYQIQRFRPKEFRSTRQTLVPSPSLYFRHPLTKKQIDLKVIDLSGSGFAVEEQDFNTTLLPGMIIPELELRFSNRFKLHGSAQVVYRKRAAGTGDTHGACFRCGLALLDMDVQDHSNLLSMLYKAHNSNAHVCNEVDLDKLWNFFFECGFVYPQKYAYLQGNKEKIKQTYQKLYTSNPNIARHFIYQNKGRILGHMAMLRFYKKSWMIHHHAANRYESNVAGLNVLNQIGRFINDSHRLLSFHMSFVLCYYRPENRFPKRVFGGAARRISDPHGSSVDHFAYFHYRRHINQGWNMVGPWSLSQARSQDLVELATFYRQQSGGLMLNALDLEPDDTDYTDLSDAYQKLGFRRERHLFALKKNGKLKAVIMVNVSNLGLNMSDLTNCIKFFVIDQDDFCAKTFRSLLFFLAVKFGQNELPVLIYPVTFADQHKINYEKTYELYVLNLEYLDHYFRFLKHLLRNIQH